MAAIDSKLVNVVPPSATHPAQMIFASGDRRSYLHLIADERLGVTYIASDATDAVEALGERLEHYSDEAIAEELEGARDEARLARALGLLALSVAGDPREDQVDGMRRGIGHPSSQVRLAALVAITYAPWPQLQPDLEGLLASEPDPMVQAHGTAALELVLRASGRIG